MTAFALGLVLAAAVLHASWNALVKAAEDRGAVLAGVAATHGMVGLCMVILFPLPAAQSVPFIAASTLLHYGYYAVLFYTYRLGDLSLAYPVSRGLAPVLVTLGAFAFAGETLSGYALAGGAAVSCGVFLIARETSPVHRHRLAIPVAILLGLIIAAYSVVDGMGVRRAGDPFAYIGWLFLLEAALTVYVLAARRRDKSAIGLNALRVGMLGGVAAAAAYGLVIYAKSIAPLGMVSAVRESSVIIAAAIGVIYFGERPWKNRMIAAAIVGCGVLLLSLLG